MLIRCLVVATGGAAGAVCRYLLSGWVQDRYGPGYPLGTFVVNMTGCLAMGFFGTVIASMTLRDEWRLLIGIGFLGAYTTFSTFSFETLNLIASGRLYRGALLNVVSSVLVGLTAAYIGIVLARLLLRGRL